MSRALFEISHDSSDSLRDDEDLENSRAKINIIGAATRIYSTATEDEEKFQKEILSEEPNLIKVLNIGEAINKRDLIRIRSGSPGLRAGL